MVLCFRVGCVSFFFVLTPEKVEFLWRRIRHAEGPRGAILADDMGVGKTVQIVALLTALFKKSGVICYTWVDGPVAWPSAI